MAKLLIGNKCDLPAKVDRQMVQEFASAMNIPFIETSAKNSTNVQEAFHTMARRIMGAQAIMNADKEKFTLREAGHEGSRGNCC